MKISEIKVGKRYRREIGDLESLKKSIKEIGLLHPIVVNKNNELIAGVRRYQACKELGLEDVQVTIVDLNDMLRGERDENVERKDFLPSEIAAIAEAIKPKIEIEIKKETREKESEAGKKGGRGHKKSEKGVGNFPTPFRGAGNFPEPLSSKKENKRVLKEVAKYTGVSDKTLKKAIEVKEAAEKEPEKYGHLVEEMDKKGKVDGVYKKLEKEKKEKQKQEQYKENVHTVNHIVHGDAIDLLDKIEAASFDLLITDPPYSTEIDDFEAFLKQWLPKAIEKIKDTGRVYIFTGSYINELLAYINTFNSLNNGFKLSNLLVWHYQNNIGPTPKYEYKRGWQGIFYLYGKNAPPLDSPLTKDLFDHFNYSLPDGRQEIKYHSHQKPEELIKQLIVLSSNRGERILDLFAGSGTIGLAASKLERYCLSIEKEIENVEICKKRGLISYEF